MKREIKFRGKRIYNGMWMEGDLKTDLVPKGSMLPCPAISTTKGTIGTFFVKTDTIGQFTGLHDKNGNDIYEGDIIRNEICKGIVVYKNGAFVLDLGKSCGCVYLFCLDSLLVVGNIYDNPELLKTK